MIFSPSFWFDLTPTALSPLFAQIFFVLFALLVLAGAVVRIIAKNNTADKYQRIVTERCGRIAFVGGMLGFIVYFFTFEEIQFFGARFWFLVWGIAVLAACVRVWMYAKKTVPQLRLRDQSRADTNKYLPRRN